MGFPQENGPTFVLRRICDQIQAKTSDLISSFKNSQIQKQSNPLSKNSLDNQQTRIKAKIFSVDSNNLSAQQSLIQAIKNDLCRIIAGELPQVVNYQVKVNEKIEDLEQEVEECKRVIKIQKQNYKESILERDNLKLQILHLQHQNKQLAEEMQSLKESQNQYIELVGKYMKQIEQLRAQNISLRQTQQRQAEDKGVPFKEAPDMTIPFAKYSQGRQINFPLQIKQKLNEAERLLNRSPRSRDLQLEASHFQMSTQIVGCQKELLEIELKKAEQQKAQLNHQFQQEHIYSKNLQKQVDNLEKLLDGEKKLNQKLDRQLYTLINATKEMKIQLLEQKAKNRQLQEQVFEMEEAVGQHHKQTTQMQQRISELQVQEKKARRLEEQIHQLKARLQISQKKYQQLRKIKQQLQQKAELFQQKLNELEKKEAQDQLKHDTFQQSINSENFSKIKQIEEMSLNIKQKYEQKIQVIQKHSKQLNDKCKFLKNQNTRLYETFDIQSKKELKLQQKNEQLIQKKQQLEQQIIVLKRDQELVQGKWKTQSLLSKQLKRQLVGAQKSKVVLERNIKRVQIFKLPKLVSQIKLLREEKSSMRSSISTYKSMISKSCLKWLGQYQEKLNMMLIQEGEKFKSLQVDYNKKQSLLQHSIKQLESSQNQKIKLLQRIDSQHSKSVTLKEQFQKKQSEIQKLTQKVSSLQSTQSRLKNQLENYRNIQKSGLQQINLLREKQKEVENFYHLVDELTQQNQQLKIKLQKTLTNQDLLISNHYHHHHSNPLLNNPSLPSYLIPQRQSKPKTLSKNHQNIHNSHSCVHLRPPSKNKHSQLIVDNPQNPSVQRKNKNPLSKPFYDQTVPSRLPIHSRPIMFNLRNSQTCMEPCQTLASQEMELAEVNQAKYNFENQKQRLEEIKNEYNKMMVDKFREDFVQKRIIQKRPY